jgi:hypothetical protein
MWKDVHAFKHSQGMMRPISSPSVVALELKNIMITGDFQRARFEVITCLHITIRVLYTCH